MNEFVPRTEAVSSIVSATERRPTGERGKAVVRPDETQTDANVQQDSQPMERFAAAADYARIQAEIARAVAMLEPPRPAAAAQADQALMAIMPSPLVILPMPPTSSHMVEFVAQVARTLASQAAQAHAAQARVSSIMVDLVTH